MSWMQKLYDTYEACESMAGNLTEKDSLLPICHTTQNAHIEIVIDNNGKIKRASVVPKDDLMTIIPCTEGSAGRTTNIKAHPLCDKLQYVAKDYFEYGGKKNYGFEKKREGKDKQDEVYYFNQLKDWCVSDYKHPKAIAVFKYIQKGSLIKDLIDLKILTIDNKGKLINKWKKIKGEDSPKIFKVINDQTESLVRWIVEIPNDSCSKLWEDHTLRESWIKYYSSIKQKKELCYIAGKEKFIADQHPKKIRYSGDGAKLISSNDQSGFTFRGRFINAEHACAVGFEVTQKAHNALRWLISRQGYKDKKGDQVIVAWAISGDDIPDLMSDTFSLIGEDDLPDDGPSMVYTAQDFGIKLKKKISGYDQKLNDSKGIVVMGLDSATPGRMAITFYRELSGSDFLKRIENWHTSCAWFHYKLKEIKDSKNGKKKTVQFRFMGAPAPDAIALAAHGHYENEIFKVDDKIRKSTVERLLPCIIDGYKIPRDLVVSATRKASNRIGFKKDSDWDKTLSTACALYRKYHDKEDYKMALEEDRRTRDYLYGRLLALADSLEQWALYKSGDKRQTGAARLMQRFADHPYSTWRTLELSLVPYKARLGGISTNRQRLIDKVKSMFVTVEEFQNDKPLSGEFLLAYSCQKEVFREATRLAKLAKENKNTEGAVEDFVTDDSDDDYQE